MRFLCTSCLVVLIWNGVYPQIGKASDFGYDPFNSTKALYNALISDFDTIIIDKQVSFWKIEPLCFYGIKDKVILFEEGCVVAALSGKFPKETDALITFENAQNLKLIGNGATLQMNKDEYVTGEWRHILSLRNCRNIRVKGFNFIDSGGDGIYISGLDKGTFSEHIEIEDIVCRNNKRQGISIISAQDVKVVNCVFNSTYGTNPQAGLDLEPNNPGDRLVRISFENCLFSENHHAGIKISLHHLNSSSVPVSILFKNCVIENNHSPENSQVPAEISVDANRTDPVRGEVIFSECLIRNSQWGILYSRKRSDAFRVVFENCTAENICLSGIMPPFFLEVPDYYRNSGPLGGFRFENFFIQYAQALPIIRVRGSKLRTLRFMDVSGRFIVNNQGPENNYIEYLQYSPNFNKGVNLEFISIAEKRKE
jgi:hypothetical protein